MRSITVPDAAEPLRPFLDAGVFGTAEVQLVEAVARLHGRPLLDAEVIALAVAARAPRLGHVGVQLDEVAEHIVGDGTDAGAHDLPWPDPVRWAEVLETSAIVHRPDAPPGPLLPLVWDRGRLHLHRLHRHEVDVAADLRQRDDATVAAVTELTPGTVALLDRLFPPPADGSPDRQRIAAETALRHPVSVIAGGPGTGKTRTIARLLAAAVADPAIGIEDVALAAPTGKAAARMTEAVHAAVAETVGEGIIPEEVAARLRTLEAGTIHSLLGLRPGGRVARNRHRPLGPDLVIVDETSMVDLPLLARLLDAVRPGARIVFVGDPHQLASVEAGTVLADLVAAGTSGRGPLDGRITVLDRVHRFGADSGIAALAEAIRGGDVDASLRLLDGSRDDLALIAPESDELERLRAEVVDAGADAVAAARAGAADEALDAVGRIKVLTALHRGANGRLDWTRTVESAVLARFPDLARHGGWYVGRPILITANDRLNRVFNGDTGVTIETTAGPVVALADRQGDDGPRLLPPARLARAESWWAMTIHKSQGSEFPHVVVSLPARPDSPVLTRELLYTAVTRARHRVAIVASPEVLATAITRRIARASGLADRLRHDPTSLHGDVSPPGHDVDAGIATTPR